MTKKNNNKNNTLQNTCFVFYNSVHPIKFSLANNREITILGSPLSEIYNPSGSKFIQGKFGISEILKSEWDEIVNLYGSMEIFQTKRIFASPTKDYGISQAKEQANQKNSAEQIDVKTTLSKPENSI